EADHHSAGGGEAADGAVQRTGGDVVVQRLGPGAGGDGRQQTEGEGGGAQAAGEVRRAWGHAVRGSCGRGIRAFGKEPNQARKSVTPAPKKFSTPAQAPAAGSRRSRRTQ